MYLVVCLMFSCASAGTTHLAAVVCVYNTLGCGGAGKIHLAGVVCVYNTLGCGGGVCTIHLAAVVCVYNTLGCGGAGKIHLAAVVCVCTIHLAAVVCVYNTLGCSDSVYNMQYIRTWLWCCEVWDYKQTIYCIYMKYVRTFVRTLTHLQISCASTNFLLCTRASASFSLRETDPGHESKHLLR